jgi:HAMP domain-containing protein
MAREPRREVNIAASPVVDIVAWRRRALEQQLPDARFPGGVKAPILVMLAGLTVTVVLVVLSFALTGGTKVPGAVVDTQRGLVRQFTRTLELGIERSVAALGVHAGDAEAKATPDLKALAEEVTAPESGWIGAIVMNPVSREVLAAQGESFDVPAAVDKDRSIVTGQFLSDEPRLVVCVPLHQIEVLCGMSPLLARSLRLNPEAQHGISLGLATGETLLLQGIDQTDAADRERIRSALAQATQSSGTVTVQGQADSSGKALLITGRQISDTGLVVVSTIREPLIAGGSPRQGLMPAALLGLLGLISLTWTWLILLRPMRRLVNQAKADASGQRSAPRTLKAPREMARISAALAGGPPPRRGLPVMAHLVVICVLGMVWSAGMVLYYGRQQVSTPAQVLSDEAARIESTSHALGSSLVTGLEEIAVLHGQVSAKNLDAARSAFARLISRDRRFRGVYLADATGKTVLSVGRESLRKPGLLPGEGGIRLDTIDGRMPVIYAYQAKIGGTAVVGEFDVEYLTGVLRAMGGEVTVVDSELRTILDSEGYVAFQRLSGNGLRDAAMVSLAGETSASVIHVQGSQIGGKRLVASAPMNELAPVAHLEWVMLSERQLTSLDLPATMRYRAATLAAGVVAAIVLFALGWQYFVLVRPLRALARQAGSISGGELDHPILMRRHDEIGAVAACLEVVRQATQHGEFRLGGAVRLRGKGDDFTAVIPRLGDEDAQHQLSTTRGS